MQKGYNQSGRASVKANSSSAVASRSKQKVGNPQRQPRPQNLEGQFYVDHTCIDCDACRFIAPDFFDRVDNQSAVVKQPETPRERQEALKALLSCPTYSIHAEELKDGELASARDSLPQPIEGFPDIYFNGFNGENTFGGSSYFIRTHGGNILMDSPRFNGSLLKKFKQMGGVKYMVLSHIDDVGDHVLWQKALNCTRVIHAKERLSVEHVLTGEGPWNLEGIDDVEILHTPGHTSGSISMFHKPTKAVFTGDHLGFSYRIGRLSIFPRYNRGGVQKQVESLQVIKDHKPTAIFPGHGRPFFPKSQGHFQHELQQAIDGEMS